MSSQLWLVLVQFINFVLFSVSPKVKNHTQLGALDRDVGVLIVESINSTASFFVDIEAYPCPSVAWSFNGIALGPTNNTFTYNNPCLEASDRSLIWTFTLNVVLTSATSGQYMADFTNINGTTSLRGPYITVPSMLLCISSLDLSMTHFTIARYCHSFKARAKLESALNLG